MSMPMKMELLSSIGLRLRGCAAGLMADCRGIAATEFAIIVPMMLVMFFGTVEFSSAVAVDRKVTLMARTLSDLTSQSLTLIDADMNNFFSAASGIMTPYPSTPTKSTISELYVDPATKVARVQWSRGAAPHNPKDVIAIPPELQVGGTYLIYSEVSYLYVPTVGYVLKAGKDLKDFSYTRPRQSTCVLYPPNLTDCTKPV
jgi:Flp pilus assembly protein TadG